MSCRWLYIYIIVFLFSCFIVILTRIPDENFISGLFSYIYKILFQQRVYYRIYFPRGFLLISPEYIFTGVISCFFQYFKLLCWLLYKIARITMVMVKPFKLYMFYGIFMALYYVFISMSISTFEVYWEIPCVEPFYFSGTM